MATKVAKELLVHYASLLWNEAGCSHMCAMHAHCLSVLPTDLCWRMKLENELNRME
jgi:hypothetical protein